MQALKTAKVHLWTVEEFRSSQVNENTELIGGVVYEVSPRNEPHVHAVRMLNVFLSQQLDLNKYMVQIQDAVAVEGWRGIHAPEVDVAVIARRRYGPEGPTAADTFAAVEVSDTTYGDDRGVKIPLYVTAGIPAWIVNIGERRVEEYERDPMRQSRIYRDGESFRILEAQVPVSELLPLVETPPQ